jgi:hypothetical protein
MTRGKQRANRFTVSLRRHLPVILLSASAVVGATSVSRNVLNYVPEAAVVLPLRSIKLVGAFNLISALIDSSTRELSDRLKQLVFTRVLQFSVLQTAQRQD